MLVSDGSTSGLALASMAAFGRDGTLFPIVSKLANSVAQVDWRLYRVRSDARRVYGPNDPQRTEVLVHPALTVWNKPNPFFTRQEFVETFQQHLDLTGEGWWVVGRDERMPGAGPTELWPVRPDRMAPVPSPTEFISGYMYRSPDGERVPLGREDVVQLRMPNPLDLYRGMGPVQAVLADLDSNRYSAEWNRAFFANSAEPGGVIEVQTSLSDPEFREMVTRWREQHQGAHNARRVAILEAGARWVSVQPTQRDMQFTELRKLSAEFIREAFGFPKFLLGTVDDVNRANAEASLAMYAMTCTVPRLERIKQALNTEFLPLFGAVGQGVEFDYCSPVPEDREADNAERASKATAAAQLVAAGWNPDDVLAAVGLPPMTWGGGGYAPPATGQLPA